MKRYSLIIALLLSLFGSIFAHTDKYYNHISGREILVGTDFEVEDNWLDYTAANGLHEMQASMGLISLRYTYEDGDIFTSGAQVSTTFDIDWYDDQGNLTTVTGITLSIDPSMGRITDVYRIDGAHRILVHNLSASTGTMSGIPDNVFLASEIQVERFFEPTLGTQLISNWPVSSDYNLTLTLPQGADESRAHFSWSKVPGAEFFQLEWVKLDDPMGDVNTDLLAAGTPNTSSRIVDFTKASRLRISTHEYDLSLLFPQSVIAYRIRPVFRWESGQVTSDDFDFYGPWSTDTWSPANPDIMPIFQGFAVAFGGLDLDRNWAMGRTFTEEGKVSEAISYRDATGKERQALSRITSQEEALATEVIYDYHGRPVVRVLPFPTGQNDLHFYDGQILSAPGDEFSKEEFDQPGLIYNMPSMDNSTGAANYYSPNNAVLNNSGTIHQHLEEKYLPDAEGYPYVRTLFMNDGTGRVKMQSGLGKTYELHDPQTPLPGDEHELRYYYTGTNITELVRLFGSEIGDPSHYRKEMTRDPNGQISVKYIDGHGRTIATGLSGDTPGNVLQLPRTPETIIAPLNTAGIQSSDGLTEVAVSHIAISSVNPTQTITFTYDLAGTQFRDDCEDWCMDCGYKVKFEVFDPEGDPVNIAINTSSLSPTSTNPGPELTFEVKPNNTIGGCTYNIVLPGQGPGLTNVEFEAVAAMIGDYKVVKTLMIDEDVLDQYVQHYEDFYHFCGQTFPSSVDLTDCDNECLNDAIAYYAALSNPNPTIEEIAEYMNDNCGGGDHFANGNTVPGGTTGNACQDECIRLQNALEWDVKVGGQYYADNDWLTYFFNNSSGYPTTPAAPTNPNDPVQLQTWRTAFEQLTQNDQDAWLSYMVAQHPEACHLSYCSHTDVQAACDWREEMNSYATLPSTTDPLGWVTWNSNQVSMYDPINFTGNAIQSGNPVISDPFFASGAAGNPYLNQVGSVTGFLDVLSHYPDGLTGSPNVYVFIENYLGANAGPTNGQIDNQAEWEMFQDIYQYHQLLYIREWKKSQGCEHLTPLTTNPNFVIGKQIRVPDLAQGMTVSFGNIPGSGASSSTQAQCDQACANNIQYWENRLSGCMEIKGDHYLWISGQYVGQMTSSFVNDLSNGGNNPMNIIDWIIHGGNDGSSTYNGLLDECEALCASDPNYYGCIPLATWSNVITTIDNLFGIDLTDYVSGTSGPTWEDELFDCMDIYPCESETFTCSCDVFLLSNPDYNQDPLLADWEEFNAMHGTSYPNAAAINAIWTDCDNQTLLNVSLPLSLKCTQLIDWTLPTVDPCSTWLTALNAYNIQAQQNQLKAQAIAQFKADYVTTCLNRNLMSENFHAEYELDEYQYTLYYYDQSGTLVQTVPPEGVNLLSGSNLNAAVVQVQLGNLIDPKHDMPTRYNYNSYQQTIWTVNPDIDAAGTNFYMNEIGQLRFSQNPKQAVGGDFSYVIYDEIGRPVEAGELDANSPSTVTSSPNMVLGSTFPTTADGDLIDPVRTVYTNLSIPTGSGFTQETENMRNRVSAVHRFQYITASYGPLEEYSMYFDYDVRGNVEKVLHENHLMKGFGDFHKFKLLEYDYDLISGNVNELRYQDGEPDQFFYKWEYDENNRLIEAYTSQHGIIWEQDADYKFYRHGPVARVELGQDLVQGTDYAYTLQGWIKGINSAKLDPDKDIGRDADDLWGQNTSLGQRFGRDAMGFSLGYFDDGTHADYSAIGQNLYGANDVMIIPDATVPAASQNPYKDLYNSNISHMVTNLLDETLQNKKLSGYWYTYDQLHRIREAENYDAYDYTNEKWLSGSSGNYKTEYTYDKNGNLLSLNRDGLTTSPGGLAMDRLTYSYIAGTNKLDHVDDLVAQAAYVPTYYDDLDDQAAGNYDYDEIGELTQDLSEFILDIEWDVHKKIAHIDYGPVNSLTCTDCPQEMWFYYDPMGNRIAKRVRDQQNNHIWTVYARDVTGNVISVYERFDNGGATNPDHAITQKEAHLYGSDRVGIWKLDRTLGEYEYDVESGYAESTPPTPAPTVSYTRLAGKKYYELSNHLGNVLSVVSGQKIPALDVNDDITDLNPEIVSYTDYFPFGSAMPERSYTSPAYRYGFNGMEKDDEVSGESNSYTTHFRQLDPRIGRWKSMDPIFQPYQSPYSCFRNSPIYFLDPSGAIGEAGVGGGKKGEKQPPGDNEPPKKEKPSTTLGDIISGEADLEDFKIEGEITLKTDLSIGAQYKFDKFKKGKLGLQIKLNILSLTLFSGKTTWKYDTKNGFSEPKSEYITPLDFKLNQEVSGSLSFGGPVSINGVAKQNFKIAGLGGEFGVPIEDYDSKVTGGIVFSFLNAKLGDNFEGTTVDNNGKSVAAQALMAATSFKVYQQTTVDPSSPTKSVTNIIIKGSISYSMVKFIGASAAVEFQIKIPLADAEKLGIVSDVLPEVVKED